MNKPKVAITLSVDANPGVLGHTVALLLESGLKYQKHRLVSNADQSENILTLEATGEVSPELQTHLITIPGVHAVVKIESSVVKNPENILQPESPSVDNIVKFWQTPRAIELIQQFESGLKSKEREQKSTQFGEQIGCLLSEEYTDILFTQTSIDDALRQVVVPALGNFVETEIKNNALYLVRSDFVNAPRGKLKLLLGLDQERCYVISGIVQGLLNQSATLPKICVRRSKCVAAGDSMCVLQVDVAK